MLRLLLFVLPLGLDTLGVSISLGIKSQPHDRSGVGSALLFSLAETVMPLVGLTIGYAVSLFLSSVMHILGPLLLIGVGLWELLEEVRERISKVKEHKNLAGANAVVPSDPQGDRKGRPYHTTAKPSDSSYSRDDHVLEGIDTRSASSAEALYSGRLAHRLGRQLLLALSVSLDELAIGFSLGAITSDLQGSKTINTITFCILIGLQGFLMTLIGLTLGGTLRVRLKFVKDWTEFLSCFLLIALGVWLIIT